MRKFALFLGVLAVFMLAIAPITAQEDTLADVANNNFLSTLVAAADAAGLVETLADPNADLTIFAPTNNAFAETLDALGITAEDLLADTDTLTQILTYHVVSGTALAADVVGLESVETLEGSSVSIAATDAGVILNNTVAVTATDLVASNGVIHIIDGVLLPPSLFPPAYVRVAHFSPDTPAVDVYLNAKISPIQGAAYPAMTGWLEVPAGTYSVAVAPAGTSIGDAAIGPVELTFEAGSRSTIAAIGSLEAGTLTAGLVEEDYDTEIALGNARVTVFHAIETAPAVDVLAGDAAIVSFLAYPGRLGSNDGAVTLDVPAGTYDLAVVPAGETAPVVLDLAGTELEAGKFYFVAAIGTIGSPDVYVDVTEMEMEETVRLEANLAQVASNNFFSTLVAAVEAAGLTDALTDENASLTVFAPTNAAFEAALADLGITAEDLLSDTDLLTQVLLYHVMDGELLAEEIAALDSFPTLQGGEVTVTVTADGVVLNEGVNIVNTNILASNGVIHVIDGVLLPPAGE